ncbi:MAG TPA: hypothetical protein VH107_14515 [Lacipirellulaceae bacterium]|nr:hypothetical protein [Lacipirellulaceae bacterium]
MSRIFLTLSLLSLGLLIAAMFLGLTMGNLYAKPEPSEATYLAASRHRLTGGAAALGVVFVESLAVTYFIGTGRWCREVVETYHFDPAPLMASNRLKRRTFPCAVLGMLAVIGVAALGAAADPATLRPNTQPWAEWHLVGACVGIVFIAWTYLVGWNNITAHHTILEDLVAEVGRVRKERGLE